MIAAAHHNQSEAKGEEEGKHDSWKRRDVGNEAEPETEVDITN